MRGDADELHRRAGEVAELSARMTALAQDLEATEKTVAEVCQQLRELGVAERLGEEFARFAIPSDVAERVQDELDRLSGELEQQAREADAPPATGPVDGGRGLLRQPDRVDEHLVVKCPDCGVHFESPVVADAGALDRVSIDDRTYACPHCGERRTYETWDHFLE